MTEQEVTRHAEALMMRYGLDGWKFVIDRNTRFWAKIARIGQCRYREKEIALSDWYITHNEYDCVNDTILHEIAHALTFVRSNGKWHGHDSYWRAICLEIGALPTRNKSQIKTPPLGFSATCPKCGIHHQKRFVNKGAKFQCACGYKPLVLKPDTGMTCEVSSLLFDLSKATRSEGRSIRAKLRRLGHRGGKR